MNLQLGASSERTHLAAAIADPAADRAVPITVRTPCVTVSPTRSTDSSILARGKWRQTAKPYLRTRIKYTTDSE
jgi:hypothetical protein